MLAEQQKELEDRLGELVSAGTLRDKLIYVFGSNEPAERIIDAVCEAGLLVERMLDNNEKKKIFSYQGVGVSLPAEALLPVKEKAVILIASKYFPQMSSQLMEMGYKEEQIFEVVHMETGSRFSTKEETFLEEFETVKKGTKVLEMLRSTYGEDVEICIFPWQAIGDIYMASRYLKRYIEKKEKEQQKDINYIITVMGNVRKKVAMLCGYERIHVLTGDESYALCRAVTFLGNRECNANILQHRFIYTNRIWHLGNYKGVTFDDHFRYSIFGLDEATQPVLPRQDEDFQRLQGFFAEHELKEGKTVIIAPYANTIANPSQKFWSDLVVGLKHKGYTVCTNSSGDESEPAIPGTKAVLFPFDITLKAIEYGGAFIGLRSGLCDLISSAKGKKVILYPDRIYAQGPVIDFYSLNRMGLCKDADEFVYLDQEPEKTLEQVLGLF